MRRLPREFVSQVRSPPIFADNQTTILSVHNFGTRSSYKHVALCVKFNEEKVAKKVVKLLYVDAFESNVADVFTKSLGRIKFTKFREIMLMEVSNEKLMN